MRMKKPPHPGRIVRQECIEPLRLTVTEAAQRLGVTRQALNNVLNGKSGISAEMSIRLSKAFGSRPQVWLGLQMEYDLAQAERNAGKISVQRITGRHAARHLVVFSFSILSTVVLLLAFDANGGEHAGRGGWGARESVFRVRCRVATPTGQRDIDLGTGFGHKSGNVLSANHVIEPCLKAKGSLQLAAADGSASIAAVIMQDAAIDLVLLKTDPGFVKNPIPIATNTTMTFGSQIASLGFPSGYLRATALLSVGYLAGVSADPNNSSIMRWVVNAAFNKGNSGGPLLETETPAVIGVVIQKFSPLTDEVKSKLEDLSKSGGPEAKVLAQAMIDIAERAQLVIGSCVIISDLQAFLRRASVEP